MAEGRPDLAKQWHPQENGDLSPKAVSLGSAKHVTWLCTACPCGHPHVWTAAVIRRARMLNTGCARDAQALTRRDRPCAQPDNILHSFVTAGSSLLPSAHG